LSNRLTPVSRRELIRRLTCMDFEGPYPGGDHEYLARSGIYVRIPNPHHGEDISVRLLSRILRDAKISRKLLRPEDRSFQQPRSGLFQKSETRSDLQASLHAATICRGPSLAGTLASDLPKTASNRVSTAPFRARVWQSHTGSASSGLPRGCLRCPSTIQEMDLTC